MPTRPDDDRDADAGESDGGLPALAALALVVGAAAGLIGALFRRLLEQADGLRHLFLDWAQGHSLLGLALAMAACAGAAAAAARMVRLYSPYASGSGIPHVEAVLRKELPQAPYVLIPVKFFGGLLAIGAGLALGREGPSVQMGATAAHLIGRVFRRDWADCRALLAAGAGAGLATAFNAPVAGAIFVLEELVRRFEPRIAIAALAASTAAISVSRAVLGDAPDFQFPNLARPAAEIGPLFLVLGALAGLAAIGYNRFLLAVIAALDRFGALTVEQRAALIGALVALIGWASPDLVGGGDVLTQRALTGAGSLAGLALLFTLRFALGALSYGARTPGGLFAPMLALGAQLGLAFGLVCQLAFPGLDIRPDVFALVGMAAFFTGVVRAPLTGIALVTEMTDNATMLLPMLGACFAAMLIPTIARNQPIYDSLRCRPEPDAASMLPKNHSG